MEQTQNVEIERKFLINSAQVKEVISLWPRSIHIRQGFLSTDKDKVVRVRKSKSSLGEQAFITVKGRSSGKNGITRAEIETEIECGAAETLLTSFCGSIVEKIRFLVKIGNHHWEIDKFLGENEGLWVAEIELQSEDEPFVLPGFVGKEVSNDPNFTNVALSLRPYSRWSDAEKALVQ
jgi:adenylate cyclase